MPTSARAKPPRNSESQELDLRKHRKFSRYLATLSGLGSMHHLVQKRSKFKKFPLYLRRKRWSKRQLIRRVLRRAYKYIGVREATGRNDGRPVRLFSNGVAEPWCANFVKTVMMEAGVRLPGHWRYLSGTSYMVDELKRYVPLLRWRWNRPRRGDLIFFADRGRPGVPRHVAIVRKVTRDKVFMIEGNFSNSVAAPKWGYSLRTGLGPKGKRRIVGYMRWVNKRGHFVVPLRIHRKWKRHRRQILLTPRRMRRLRKRYHWLMKKLKKTYHRSLFYTKRWKKRRAKRLNRKHKASLKAIKAEYKQQLKKITVQTAKKYEILAASFAKKMKGRKKPSCYKRKWRKSKVCRILRWNKRWKKKIRKWSLKKKYTLKRSLHRKKRRFKKWYARKKRVIRWIYRRKRKRLSKTYALNRKRVTKNYRTQRQKLVLAYQSERASLHDISHLWPLAPFHLQSF